MIHVNKYKIRTANLSGSTHFNFEVPFNQVPSLLGQTDIINEKFVKIQVEESINPILDYEKVRFAPIISDTNKIKGYSECDFINYKLMTLSDNAYINTTWADIGFGYNDILFKKNSYTKSFLRLDFYDSDIGTKQQLLFFKTIFASNNTNGTPNFLPLEFKVGNSIKDRNRDGEGFFLYYFKEDVVPTIPTKIYMRATLQNSKNGKSTTFMSSSNPMISIDELAKTESGMLYTRYLLKRNDYGYYYEIDETYSNNISSVLGYENNYTVNLYQISVL